MPYQGDYSTIVRMYDGDYAKLRTPSGDVDFYVEEAKRCGGPVAEFGCGSGRILIPTVLAGIEAVGVDSSEAMLAQARANHEGLQLHLGDMRDCDLGRRFKLVTIPFRALSHVEEADDHIRVFENMRRHLDSDGRLIFDVFHPSYKHLSEPQENVLGIEREEDGKQIRRYHTSVPSHATQSIAVIMRWEVEDASGAIEEFSESFSMRYFFRYELEHALVRAGLAVETIWGRFDRTPFVDGSPEMIFVCRSA
jgi:SAM-dependent methyltransferase